MRIPVFNLIGAAALGVAILAAAPAQAQVSVTIGTPGYYPPPPPSPVYRALPVYEDEYAPPRRVYRPVGFYGGPRCRVRTHRYWNGFRWVVERRRRCW